MNVIHAVLHKYNYYMLCLRPLKIFLKIKLILSDVHLWILPMISINCSGPLYPFWYIKIDFSELFLSTGAKSVLGSCYIIPNICAIIQFGPKTSLAPVFLNFLQYINTGHGNLKLITIYWITVYIKKGDNCNENSSPIVFAVIWNIDLLISGVGLVQYQCLWD